MIFHVIGFLFIFQSPQLKFPNLTFKSLMCQDVVRLGNKVFYIEKKFPYLKLECFSIQNINEAMHNMSVHQLSLVLPNTVGTFHGLNCCSHVIYAPQTRTYQNTVKPLTYPNILHIWFECNFEIKSLDGAVCILLCINVLEIGMNLSLFYLSKGK